MDQQTFYPTEPHISPSRPAEEWHLTEDEYKAVNRYGTADQSGIMPSVLYQTMAWQPVPLTQTSPGAMGMKAIDENYMYICIRNNFWKRVPVESTF